jgi:hypothetical protein
MNCIGSRTEGLEICLVLMLSLCRFSFLLADLGTVGLDLLVDEVECFFPGLWGRR